MLCLVNEYMRFFLLLLLYKSQAPFILLDTVLTDRFCSFVSQSILLIYRRHFHPNKRYTKSNLLHDVPSFEKNHNYWYEIW